MQAHLYIFWNFVSCQFITDAIRIKLYQFTIKYITFKTNIVNIPDYFTVFSALEIMYICGIFMWIYYRVVATVHYVRVPCSVTSH